jgi:hypothetical protein
MSSYGSEFKKEKDPLISLFWKSMFTAIGGGLPVLGLGNRGNDFYVFA